MISHISSFSLSDSVPLYDYSFSGSGMRSIFFWNAKTGAPAPGRRPVSLVVRLDQPAARWPMLSRQASSRGASERDAGAGRYAESDTSDGR